MTSRFSKTVRASLLASGLLALAAPSALAGDSGSGWIQSASPSPLVVVSNGSAYTQTSGPENLSLTAKLVYSTGVAGRVKSWEAWPEITSGYGVHTEVSNLRFWGGESKSYPVGSRPKALSLTIGLTVPRSMLDQVAVGMCSWLAHSLRDDGLSNAQIFGSDREVKLLAGLRYVVDASGAGSGSPVFEYAPPLEIPVRCARTAGPALPVAGAVKAAPQAPSIGKIRAPTSDAPATGGIRMPRTIFPEVGGMRLPRVAPFQIAPRRR
jgi:hypothetical protein